MFLAHVTADAGPLLKLLPPTLYSLLPKGIFIEFYYQREKRIVTWYGDRERLWSEKPQKLGEGPTQPLLAVRLHRLRNKPSWPESALSSSANKKRP